MSRTVVPIVGMHRSGTSATAGCLAATGLDFGPPGLLMPASPANPKGYFEAMEVVAIHDELLLRLGCAWDSPQVRGDWRLLSSADRAKDSLAEWLSRLNGPGPFAVKDPRMCLFPELWLHASWAAGVALEPVIVTRETHAVCRSLMRRDRMPHEHALELLYYYGHGVTRWLEIHQLAAVIRFEQLLHDPVGTLVPALSPIGIPTEGWQDRVRDFIDEELVHG